MQYDLWQLLAVFWDGMSLNHSTKRLSLQQTGSQDGPLQPHVVLFFWPSHLPVHFPSSVYSVPVQRKPPLNHLWRWEQDLTATNWSKTIFSQKKPHAHPGPTTPCLLMSVPHRQRQRPRALLWDRGQFLFTNAHYIDVSWFHHATRLDATHPAVSLCLPSTPCVLASLM